MTKKEKTLLSEVKLALESKNVKHAQSLLDGIVGDEITDRPQSLANALIEGYIVNMYDNGCASFQSPQGKMYFIDNFHCDCPDKIYNGGSYQGKCKHELWHENALSFWPDEYQQAQQIQQREDDRIDVSRQSYDDNKKRFDEYIDALAEEISNQNTFNAHLGYDVQDAEKRLRLGAFASHVLFD